jgi:hypothetical protein
VAIEQTEKESQQDGGGPVWSKRGRKIQICKKTGNTICGLRMGNDKIIGNATKGNMKHIE